MSCHSSVMLPFDLPCDSNLDCFPFVATSALCCVDTLTATALCCVDTLTATALCCVDTLTATALCCVDTLTATALCYVDTLTATALCCVDTLTATALCCVDTLTHLSCSTLNMAYHSTEQPGMVCLFDVCKLYTVKCGVTWWYIPNECLWQSETFPCSRPECEAVKTVRYCITKICGKAIPQYEEKSCGKFILPFKLSSSQFGNDFWIKKA